MKVCINHLVRAYVLVLIVGNSSAFAVDDGEKHSDTWLEAKIGTLIAVNSNLSIFDIDTEVKNQIAYLSGSVKTDIEKDLAGEIAKSVEGVTSVENDIVVNIDKAEEARVEREKKTQQLSLGQRVEDLTITATVKSKLLANSNVSGLAVNVNTKAGAVTLQGTVKTAAERELVERLTQNTSGVKSVTNELKVDGAS